MYSFQAVLAFSLPPKLLPKMAESDFMAYGSIEMIFACLAAFWVALQVLQTVSD